MNGGTDGPRRMTGQPPSRHLKRDLDDDDDDGFVGYQRKKNGNGKLQSRTNGNGRAIKQKVEKPITPAPIVSQATGDLKIRVRNPYGIDGSLTTSPEENPTQNNSIQENGDNSTPKASLKVRIKKPQLVYFHYNIPIAPMPNSPFVFVLLHYYRPENYRGPHREKEGITTAEIRRCARNIYKFENREQRIAKKTEETKKIETTQPHISSITDEDKKETLNGNKLDENGNKGNTHDDISMDQADTEMRNFTEETLDDIHEETQDDEEMKLPEEQEALQSHVEPIQESINKINGSMSTRHALASPEIEKIQYTKPNHEYGLMSYMTTNVTMMNQVNIPTLVLANAHPQEHQLSKVSSVYDGKQIYNEEKRKASAKLTDEDKKNLFAQMLHRTRDVEAISSKNSAEQENAIRKATRISLNPQKRNGTSSRAAKNAAIQRIGKCLNPTSGNTVSTEQESSSNGTRDSSDPVIIWSKTVAPTRRTTRSTASRTSKTPILSKSQNSSSSSVLPAQPKPKTVKSPAPVLNKTKPTPPNLCKPPPPAKPIISRRPSIASNNSRSSLVRAPSVTQQQPQVQNAVAKRIEQIMTQQVGPDESVDTKDVCDKVQELLRQKAITQEAFARNVLGRSQGTFSDLLRNIKPWQSLKAGRETLTRMRNFLILTPKDRQALLNMDPKTAAQVCGLPPPKCQKKERKKRLTFTDHQKNALENWFKIEQKPNKEAMVRMANELALETETVMNYFTNRRRIFKRDCKDEVIECKKEEQDE